MYIDGVRLFHFVERISPFRGWALFLRLTAVHSLSIHGRCITYVRSKRQPYNQTDWRRATWRRSAPKGVGYTQHAHYRVFMEQWWISTFPWSKCAAKTTLAYFYFIIRYYRAIVKQRPLNLDGLLRMLSRCVPTKTLRNWATTGFIRARRRSLVHSHLGTVRYFK